MKVDGMLYGLATVGRSTWVLMEAEVLHRPNDTGKGSSLWSMEVEGPGGVYLLEFDALDHGTAFVPGDRVKVFGLLLDPQVGAPRKVRVEDMERVAPPTPLEPMRGRVLTRPKRGEHGVTFVLAPDGGGEAVTVRTFSKPPPIGAKVRVDGGPFHWVEVLDRGVGKVLRDWIGGCFSEEDRELYEVVHDLIQKQDGRGATIPETGEWLERLEGVVHEARTRFVWAGLDAGVPEEAP